MLKYLYTLYRRLTTGGSTEEQAIQSGIWMVGINVGDRVLQILKIIILARLLSPKAFGLLGIALLAIASLRQFSELGFNQALIQNEKENVDALLNTAWVIKIARGLIVAAIAVVAAPTLANLFGEPEAAPLIRYIGFTPLILGLQNPAVIYFQKNLNFHREFVYLVGGRLVDLVVAVVIALFYGDVWALAAGLIAMNIIKFLLSYIIHEYRPSVEFELKHGKEMFGFGKWIFASAILVFLYSQGDDVFVGWYFTAASLGFYQIAYRFSNAPATEVTHIISRVAFPAFSQVQNDIQRLRQGYFRAVQLSTMVAFPMSVGIAVVAPQFVHVALGDQWDPVVPLMQVLAIWGGLRAFGANVGPVFKSVGKPDIEVKIQALKVLVIIITIFPAAENLGVVGVAATIVGSSFITLPVALYFVLSIIEAEAMELLRLVFYPLTGSFGMGAIVFAVDMYLFNTFGLLQLIVLIALGGIVYTLLMLAIESKTSCEFSELYILFRQTI
jgi:O-antigen/teichoic acid export membrane protein